MELRKYQWACDWPGCNEVLKAYSEKGLETLRQFHFDHHKRMEVLKPIVERSEAIVGPLIIPAKSLYDVLILTDEDRRFLRTMKVKVEY